jgi:hypothetical protein
MPMKAWRSLEWPAKCVTVLLAGMVLLHAVSAIALVAQIDLLGRLQAGVALAPGEAEQNDARINMLAVLSAPAFWACAIGFLIWFHRAANNLAAFDVAVPFDKWGAVTSFMIPFLNVIRPYQVMHGVWLGSASSAAEHADSIVGYWWGAYISMNLLAVASRFSFRFANGDLNSLSTGTIVGIVHQVVAMVAAVLAILVVRRITARQHAKKNLDVAAEFA